MKHGRRKRLVLWIASVVLVPMLAAFAASTWSGYSIPVVRAEVRDWHASGAVRGGSFAPLENFDFSEGEWVAYLVVEHDDYFPLRRRLRRNCLKLTDREALKELAAKFRFRVTGGDMATLTSLFVVTRNGEVRFASEIALEPRGGLQSRAFGWAEEEQQGMLMSAAAKFEPMRSPIVYIP